MTPKESLLKKVTDHSLVIGIYGLGYVGLPLAIGFVDAGFRVIGFDIDEQKIDALGNGTNYLPHIDISPLLENPDMFSATSDFSKTPEADALVICVPTPLSTHRDPDLSFVTNTIDSIAPWMRAGQMLSLESTTYPGTTEEEIRPRIEARDLKVGEDFFLVYSPEREDPGNPDFTTRTIPKVCGGVTPDCLEVGLAIYGKVIDRVIPVSSVGAAEMTKLLENIQRAVNIGLINEMKMVTDHMGIDIYEVIDAAATKPFGFVPYYPGPGLGGHCIPIDPFYLTWKAHEYGDDTRFIELAGQINNFMPEWVVHKISAALNTQGKAINGSHILILGIAYKKNVGDVRETPAAKVMEILRKRGAVLSYHDPHVPHFPHMRQHQFDLNSTAIDSSILPTFDCVAIITDHDDFDYELILEHALTIVDSRGRYRAPNPKVVRA